MALRSREEQRRYALRGYMLRTWVDHALTHAERLLMIAAALIFGYWFIDGPARDWLHEQSAQHASASAREFRAEAPESSRADATEAGEPESAAEEGERAAGGLVSAVPLPYITADMRAAEARDAAEGGRERRRASEPLAELVPKVAPEPSRLVIPAIGLDTPVREVFIRDGVWEVAEYAAGYLHGTALPGTNGNTALAGHAGLRGAVFRNLGALQPGHEVFVDAGGRRYRYIVRESFAVWPTQVEVLEDTPTPVLTMITCTNWDTQRLVVVADLVDSQPAP